MEKPTSLFRLVWLGYVVGTGTILLPVVLLGFAPAMIHQSKGDLTVALLFACATPVILIVQGAAFGGIVSLGWWVIGKLCRAKI